jgi:hypothetical protein
MIISTSIISNLTNFCIMIYLMLHKMLFVIKILIKSFSKL